MGWPNHVRHLGHVWRVFGIGCDTSGNDWYHLEAQGLGEVVRLWRVSVKDCEPC